MTDRPAVPVVLRRAKGGWLGESFKSEELIKGPVYARAGEATYCANGHVLGHFVKDVMIGEINEGALVPVDGMSLGTLLCPWCDAETNISGTYFFAKKETES